MRRPTWKLTNGVVLLVGLPRKDQQHSALLKYKRSLVFLKSRWEFIIIASGPKSKFQLIRLCPTKVSFSRENTGDEVVKAFSDRVHGKTGQLESSVHPLCLFESSTKLRTLGHV